MIRSSAAVLLLLATPALADDARIVTRAYDPARIVSLPARAGIQTTVAFSDDERIENVALGDSADWQVTPNKRASLLFVKPMGRAARTNMTVVTDRRTYLFDLFAGGRGAPVYMLRFSYPHDAPTRPVQAPVVALAPPPPVVEPAAAAEPPQRSPAELNFAWQQSGARALLPQRLFDDGRETWLAWDRDATLPAILQREPGGGEGPVNYTVRGEYVVVDGVPGQIVLRAGKQVALLTPRPRAVPPPASPPAVPPLAPTPALTPAQTASIAR